MRCQDGEELLYPKRGPMVSTIRLLNRAPAWGVGWAGSNHAIPVLDCVLMVEQQHILMASMD